MWKRYKAGDVIPIGDLLRAYIDLMWRLKTDEYWGAGEGLRESERLMRATLNGISQAIPDLPGEIVILFDDSYDLERSIGD